MRRLRKGQRRFGYCRSGLAEGFNVVQKGRRLEAHMFADSPGENEEYTCFSWNPTEFVCVRVKEYVRTKEREMDPERRRREETGRKNAWSKTCSASS